jgi:hypothetical protein
MPPRGIVLCARSDPGHGDVTGGADISSAIHKPCEFCQEDLLISPTSAALEGAVYACNPCGRATVAEQVRTRGIVPALRIAPGALEPTTPDNRRRRSELEAHGFTDLQPGEFDRLARGEGL